ncbi:MAG: chloride channel protein [Sarcina sp.]
MTRFLRDSVGVLYSGIIGAIVGLLSWVFLYTVYLGLHLFWHEFILEQNSKVLILVICLIGGVCVGICEKYIGKYPKTMHMVLYEYKSTGRVEYKSLPKAIIKIFTVLWFGGTVGPEAGLSGILGGLVTYVGEFLKFGFVRKEHKRIEVSGANQIFEIPKYGLYNFVDKADKKKAKNIKRLLYGSAILFGTIAFLVLNKIDNKASFITKFAHSTIDKTSLIYFVPLFIIGLLIVAYSAILDKIIPIIFKPLEKYKILNSIVGGLILGIIAISVPYILFSGEHSLKELIGGSSILGIGVFIAIGAFKLISSKVCIQTGWIGGPIFPIMFASAAFGIAISNIFGIDLPFAVAIIMSTALAGIMQNFKITVVLLIFFFSMNTWPFILITAVLSELIVKKMPKFEKPQLEEL